MSNGIHALVDILFSGEDVGPNLHEDLIGLAKCTTTKNIVQYFNNNRMVNMFDALYDFIYDLALSGELMDFDLSTHNNIKGVCDDVVRFGLATTNPTPLLFGVFDLCFLAFTNNMSAVLSYPNIKHLRMTSRPLLVSEDISLPTLITTLHRSIKENGYYQIKESLFSTMDEYATLVLSRFSKNINIIRTSINDTHSLPESYNKSKIIGLLRLLKALEDEINWRL